MNPTPHVETPPADKPRLSDSEFKKELEALIPQIRAFSRFLCQSDRARADDLAQEGLMRAWQARASFTPGTQMRAWIFVITRNLFYSERRRAWRSVAYDETAAERTLRTEAVQGDQLDLDDVRRAMATLPDDQREALILVSAGGLSYEEAATVCQCAVGTIKSRVNRGRKALVLKLESTGMPARDLPADHALASLVADAKRVATDR